MSDEWKAPVSQKADEAIESREEAKSWKLLEKTLLASVQEQRRARRWGIFFKLLTVAFLFVAIVLPMLDIEGGASRRSSHTALIDVQGVIADKESASAENITTALRDAFGDEKTKGVILRINSPGGSPVQSGYVYDEIRRLRAEKPNIKVYAVITDLGASGAYYIASAADQIYADKASLVGSIGVTAAGFGFVGAMEKLGVDRRTYTSGEHKAFLDPFQPQKADETQFWQSVLDTTHRQFIASVKQGRGDRLKDKDHPEMFSGLVWTGEQAVALGLVDGLGSASYVAREVIKEKDIVEYTVEESPFDRFSKKLGTSIAERIAMLVGFGGPSLR
ncbi:MULTISPECIES: S49 family peptidase [Pseudomonas syringae group]|uniref:S49 family peptidase n=1 Tax=Pseudomonas syringae group TaxID=136849 RepID=UPI0005C94B0A|nr:MULTISPECIES: S49 family peptidase [Pseudomonas syringae group]KPC08280.1 Signal peptide peptidase SppA [Pseudomonas syringae pv. maculicola str. M6]KPW44287.1 Signal peptide peptidase SppA, 36K type [Pseudomonas syringae pv. berberidis]KPX77113.1 Signal peptide peptidase SppA, 36K type [Pseudomonas syringae pv. maculicola]KPY19614.1 Signal peptide peptidase SppA, 36K type [Pseudomonas syringae pv. philadelphi]MCF5243376.1 S49 family peptidase [Pseudomonas syringae]